MNILKIILFVILKIVLLPLALFLWTVAILITYISAIITTVVSILMFFISILILIALHEVLVGRMQVSEFLLSCILPMFFIVISGIAIFIPSFILSVSTILLDFIFSPLDK